MSVVLTVGANDTERSLTGLMMGTKYNITIVATNTAGDGDAVVLVQPTQIDRTFMREGGRDFILYLLHIYFMRTFTT